MLLASVSEILMDYLFHKYSTLIYQTKPTICYSNFFMRIKCICFSCSCMKWLWHVFHVLFLWYTTDAGVIISPSHDYTTFENNASIFTFNCSGNGTSLLWTVDGYFTGEGYVLNKGIRYTPFIVSPDGLNVSSQLIVPTIKANNNITVICIVQDSLFNHQSSNPVKLFLQGTVLVCMHV